MIHLKKRRSFEPQISRFSVLIFYQTVVLLLLIHFSEGQSQMVGPLQPIVAMLGDDIILPCQVEPAEDAVPRMVEWARLDLDPRFVHVRRGGVELLTHQNPSYNGRTSLSINKLRRGDLSLTLSRVKISDQGTYRCLISTEERQLEVKLAVGSVSSPIVKLSKVSAGLLLECKTEGWYPEPEVSWLDSEGHVLSAGPTETVRGPDGLYTVSSRVTVEERHRNSFTCRVQQKDINQIRETQIHVPDDLFLNQSVYVYTTIGLAVCVILILAVAFVVWRRGRIQTKTKWHQTRDRETGRTSSSSSQVQLQTEGKGVRQEDVARKEAVKLLNKRMGKLEEELQKNVVEFKDVEESVDMLIKYKRDLEEYIEELGQFSTWIDTLIEENETHFSSWFGWSVKAKYQDIITDLENRKEANEILLQKTEDLHQKTENEIMQIEERKRKLDTLQEKINQDREAAKRNRDAIQDKL